MINTTTVPPLGVALSGRERYRCHDANLIDLALNRTQGNIIVTESYFQTESTQKLSSTMNYDAYDTSQSSLYTGPDDPAVTINRGTAKALYISLYVIVFLVSVLGNSLVIITIGSNKRMRNLTNIFLLSMAVSDLLIALVCLPINLTGRILTRFIFGSFMCHMFPYVIGVSVMVSTYTMLAISIERYFAICCPFNALTRQTKRHAYTVTVCIWVASFIVMLPYVIASRLDYRPIPGLGKCVKACRLVIANQNLSRAWYAFLLIGIFCLPGIIMAVAYIRVCLTLHRGFQFKPNQGGRTPNGSTNGPEQNSSLSANTQCQHSTSTLLSPDTDGSSRRVVDSRAAQNSAQNNNNNTRTVVMLIMIVIFYFIFWTPLYFANMWKAFDHNSAVRSLENFIEIIKLMSYTSTCVNPVIYCFMNKKFREGFIKAFLCCLPAKCAQKVKRRPFGTSHGVSETQQLTIMSSSRLPRHSPSPA